MVPTQSGPLLECELWLCDAPGPKSKCLALKSSRGHLWPLLAASGREPRGNACLPLYIACQCLGGCSGHREALLGSNCLTFTKPDVVMVDYLKNTQKHKEERTAMPNATSQRESSVWRLLIAFPSALFLFLGTRNFFQSQSRTILSIVLRICLLFDFFIIQNFKHLQKGTEQPNEPQDKWSPRFNNLHVGKTILPTPLSSFH